jgi:hypothetical protein
VRKGGEEVSDDLTLKLFEKIDGKLDGLLDRTARLEERQEAARVATEHSRNNASLAIKALTDQFVGLRGELEQAGERHQALVIRVVKVEDAQQVLSDKVTGAALKSGGIGAGIGTGIGAALTYLVDPILKKLGIT